MKPGKYVPDPRVQHRQNAIERRGFVTIEAGHEPTDAEVEELVAIDTAEHGFTRVSEIRWETMPAEFVLPAGDGPGRCSGRGVYFRYDVELTPDVQAMMSE